MLEFLLTSFAATFVISLLLLPSYIKKAHEAGIVGLDIHKPNTPAVAESGGVVLMIAYLIGLFFFIPFLGDLKDQIIGTAATILFSSLIGFIDDIYKTRWRLKILTPLIAGVPLAVMRLGRTTISTPFGILDFATLGFFGLILFYALVVPFIVTACANAVNMYAGLNGLEVGSTVIMASALLILSLIRGGPQLVGSIIIIPFLGAAIAFLIYNRYPSRVFPGDIGTFGMGSVIACCAMLANLERAVLIMFIPHTINAILFFFGKFRGKSPPKEAPMNPDDTIPCRTIWSLRCVILRIHPMKEKSILYTMWIIVAVFAVIGMLVYGI